MLDRILYGFTLRAAPVVRADTLNSPEPMFLGQATLTLETSLPTGQLHYTLDGNEPTAQSPAYTDPLTLNRTTTLQARWFEAQGQGPLFTRTYYRLPTVKHAAVGQPAELVHPPHRGYAASGAPGLTNGLLCPSESPWVPGWLGFTPAAPLEATLDLGQPIRIDRLSAHFLKSGWGIGLPKRVTYSVSDDGKQFGPVALVEPRPGSIPHGWFTAPLGGVPTRYVRVAAEPGAEWTFTDEIAVNPEPLGLDLRHAAVNAPVALRTPPSPDYALATAQGLTDGYLAQAADCRSVDWLGFEGVEFEATVDLGQPTRIRRAGARFLHQIEYGVALPRSVEVSVSEEGETFRTVAAVPSDPPPPRRDQRFTRDYLADLPGVTARYVRLRAFPAAQWIFVDEVIVNPSE
jgi:hypothetical protein